MMGDRDYRNLIKNAIDSIGRELEPQIDVKDIKTIHLHEIVQCLRRSYYDRLEPKEVERTGFNDLLTALLRRLNYGSEPKSFDVDELKLRGQADMVIDDAIIIFRSTEEPLEIPKANDVLYLNACMWLYNKMDGVVIYITKDRKESSFSVTKNKKMFEETIRRIRVLHDLLREKKVPILEPSEQCSTCQYYDRCYINMKMGRPIVISELFGIKKDEKY
jgi:CRISPR-associated exonuclease Cas4